MSWVCWQLPPWPLAVSGVGGTVAYTLFYNSTEPILTTWQRWLASGALGMIAIAPLVIGLVKALREPPSRNEILEGIAALVALAAMIAIIILLPPEPWKTVRPTVLLFPILLWITARCPPVFAAAAAFIVSLAIVWTIIFGIGHFERPVLPVSDRILRAQAAILSFALCAYVLAALFAERRQHEAALKESKAELKGSEARLQEALAAGAMMAFEYNPMSGLAKRSDNAAQILGLGPQQTLTAPNSSRGFIRTTSRASRRTITGPAPTVPPRSPFVSFAPMAKRCGLRKPHGRNSTRPAASYVSRPAPRYYEAQARRGTPGPAERRTRPPRQKRARARCGSRQSNAPAQRGPWKSLSTRSTAAFNQLQPLTRS